MRVCIDIDGTLCEIKQAHQTYADVQPLAGAVEQLKAMRDAGYYIILATARHMKTCDANVGMVIARQGKTLLQWLDDHQIEYDEIWFGKPNADLYIDDRALRFNNNWHEINIKHLEQLVKPESQNAVNHPKDLSCSTNANVSTKEASTGTELVNHNRPKPNLAGV